MKLDELFLDTLRDIYFAERQILKALPKMTKAAQEPKLKKGFTAHREETQGQVERLQQVFEILGKRAQGKTCETIQGLIEECDELLGEATEPSTVRDAGLIAPCGQAQSQDPAHDLIRLGLSLAMAARGSDLPGVTTAHMLEHMIDGYEAAFAPEVQGETLDASSAMPKSVKLVMREGRQVLEAPRGRTDRRRRAGHSNRQSVLAADAG